MLELAGRGLHIGVRMRNRDGLVGAQQHTIAIHDVESETRTVAIVHGHQLACLSPRVARSSEHEVARRDGGLLLQCIRSCRDGYIGWAFRNPVERRAITPPRGHLGVARVVQQREVVVELDRDPLGLAAALVVVQSAGDAPVAAGAFLVDHGVVIAVVAADQDAVAGNGDATRMPDGRGALAAHVIAAGIFEDRDRVTELDRGDAVLHGHTDAHAGPGYRVEHVPETPDAVAVASVQQGLLSSVVGRQHDDAVASMATSWPNQVKVGLAGLVSVCRAERVRTSAQAGASNASDARIPASTRMVFMNETSGAKLAEARLGPYRRSQAGDRGDDRHGGQQPTAGVWVSDKSNVRRRKHRLLRCALGSAVVRRSRRVRTPH